MKQSARGGVSGLAQLVEMNPVPASERDGLIARLNEIKPELPQLGLSAGRPPWKPRIIVLAVVAVLGVGGVAVAASWDPLSTIGAVDPAPEPTDTLSPAVIEQLRANEQSPPGWISPIGTRLVEQARLLGALPDGHNVHAVPTSKGKLCIVVADRTESCSDPLTHAQPITLTVVQDGPAVPPVVWGATTNDVVSVTFEVGGQPVTVPAEDNFYVWEGQPGKAQIDFSAATVTFSDGSSAPAG